METAGAASNYRTSVAFFLLLQFGIGGAFFPFVMFLNRPFWLVWVAASSAFVGAIYLYQLRSTAARPLTALEFSATAAASIFPGSAVVVVLLLLYGLLRAILALIGLTGLAWDGAGVSRTLVAVLGFPLLLGTCSTGADVLRKRLFPRTGIGNAPLFPGLTWRRFLLISLPIVAAAAALIVLGFRGWLAGWILLALLAAGGSANLHTGLEGEAPPKLLVRAKDALVRLLEAAGYTALLRLQAPEPNIDRLITIYDLVAYRDGHLLALRIKSEVPQFDTFPLVEAAPLRTAARAIRRAVEQNGVAVHSVSPTLVLVGFAAAPSLCDVAAEDSIHIVELGEPAVIDDILRDPIPPEELRRLSQTLLQLESLHAAANGGHTGKGSLG